MKNGYSSVSMQNIIDRSNTSKGAIYYHFKSKLEIFEEIMLKFFTVSYDQMYDFLESLGSMKTLMPKLIEFVNFHENSIKAVFGGKQAMQKYLYLLLEGLTYSRKIKSLQKKMNEKINHLIFNILQEGKNRGELKPVVDCRALANQFIYVLSGIPVLIAYGLNISMAESVEQIFGLFWDKILIKS